MMREIPKYSYEDASNDGLLLATGCFGAFDWAHWRKTTVIVRGLWVCERLRWQTVKQKPTQHWDRRTSLQKNYRRASGRANARESERTNERTNANKRTDEWARMREVASASASANANEWKDWAKQPSPWLACVCASVNLTRLVALLVCVFVRACGNATSTTAKASTRREFDWSWGAAAPRKEEDGGCCFGRQLHH